MQGKHSRTPGAGPNLIPGEFGVNLADKTFHMRAAGKKITVPMALVEGWSAPAEGTEGAPLRISGDKAIIDDRLLPLGVVNGKVTPDEPPGLLHQAIPGVTIGGVAAPYVLPAGNLLIEPFYVASDGFVLKKFVFVSDVAPTANVKLGVAQVNGEALELNQINQPPLGYSGADWTRPLAQGWYYAFLWTEDDLTLRQMQTYRSTQGFSLSGDTPQFIQRRFGTPGAYRFANLPPILIQSTEVGPAPGEPRAFAFQWEVA